MKSQTKLIIGALAAVALGTVVAGLFGTEEGRKARKSLSKKKRKLRNKTLQQIGELKVSSRRKYESVKQAASDIIDEGKEMVSGIVGGESTSGTTATANTASKAGATGGAGKAGGTTSNQ